MNTFVRSALPHGGFDRYKGVERGDDVITAVLQNWVRGRTAAWTEDQCWSDRNAGYGPTAIGPRSGAEIV